MAGHYLLFIALAAAVFVGGCKKEDPPPPPDPQLSFIGVVSGQEFKCYSRIPPSVGGSSSLYFFEKIGFLGPDLEKIEFQIFFNDFPSKEMILGLKGTSIPFDPNEFPDFDGNPSPKVHGGFEYGTGGIYYSYHSYNSDNSTGSFFKINEVNYLEGVHYSYEKFSPGAVFLVTGNCHFIAEEKTVTGAFQIVLVEFSG